MSTRVCPKCGSQYVASVRRCIDCDLILVDEVDPKTEEVTVASAATPVNAGDEVAYELPGWSNQLKLSLEGMLDRAGIRRVWEAAVLVVPAEFEEEVDALIATVEGVELEDLDDEDDARVAFDVEVLSAGELEELDARLYADGIAHAWTEELELLVREDVAQHVEEVIDAILRGEGIAETDDAESFDAQQRLSSLYVAVDKLVKSPLDAKPATRFVKAADGIEDHGVPYGLAGEDWDGFLALVADLRALVDPDGVGIDEEGQDEEGQDEAVDREGRARVLATDLRDRLRDLV